MMTFGRIDPTPGNAKPFALRPKMMSIIAVVSLLIIASGIEAGWTLAFEHKMYPGVYVGRIALGGLTREEATRALQTRFAEIISQGVTIVVDRSTHIDLDVIAESDPDLSRPLLDADIATAVEHAYAEGRSRNAILNLFLGLLPVFERPQIAVPITMDRTGISDRILSAFPEYDVEPAPTKFLITPESPGWRVAVMEGEVRTTLDIQTSLSALEIGFSRLDRDLLSSPLSISPVTLKPEVNLEEAVRLIPDAEAVLASAPFFVVYEDEDGQTHSWNLQGDDLSRMLVPTRNGLDLDKETLLSFFELVTADVNVEARDARLAVNGSRAEMFIPSQSGRKVNVEASAALLRKTVLAPAQEPITLVVHKTEPNVVLAEANDLGIKELLGTGTSSYAGSPSNRIKNIRNGVRLLNGLLIPPGETFSLLGALAPFTTENGYLPELVIKGDKIIPEIGGGLCQIGSTTFRATMNAGLEVTERRNHSLVVSYYNDPSNGNPGTDATIYSPAPDYKFVNNTPGYLLFEAIMDETSKQLLFSFWGTSDGRKGWYDPPVVEQWFGAGETRMIETTDIPAGTTQCQSAHPGANASFTYHVRSSDGIMTDRVFTSSYRSLPKVCLVGVEISPEPTSESSPPDGEEIPPTSNF